MPWFVLDDGFDTHPKVRKVGNAAVGVFVRLGAYAARHLTEGKLDAAIVRDYGTPPTIKKLVAVGLLHPFGHDCPRCEQPDGSGYTIHDFLDYNRSRKQVEAAREAGRKRQQKGRDRAREQRNARSSEAETNANPRGNEADSDANPRGNEGSFEGSTAGQEGSSRRDTLQGEAGVPSHPIPSPLPTEEGKTASYARQTPGEPQIPDASQPLVAALQAERLFVGWDLRPGEWLQIEALIRRCGVPALVTSARASWQGAHNTPRSGRYFLPAWKAMAASTPELPGGVVPFPGPGAARPSTTDQRVQAAIEAGRRMQAKADAARAANQETS
ncbi:hypothetical protein [Streptomyces sp. SBT349]|uniref:hypothetical protein n=1 Tax=Streptomyces sp. SBT349 TaxID=1580539 RepID=UPI00066CE0BC|nr:hypothetical protein [Streptomyces sp. SBT349]